MFLIRHRVELRAHASVRFYETPLQYGDKNAHVWRCDVVDDGTPVDMTGYTVTLFAKRADGVTAGPVEGTAANGYVTATLTPACYAVPGDLTLVLRAAVTGGDAETITLAILHAKVSRDTTDTVVDPDGVVPDLTQLLAQIQAMELATGAANDAAEYAEAQGDYAKEMGDDADEAATAATTAAGAAASAASAANSAADAAETAAQQVTDAIIPSFSIGTVESVPASQGASATVTGTAKYPVLNLAIPRGLDGSGSVQTVGGVSPNGSGNVPISVAGVSPNTTTGNVPLTAADVDAVPETREICGHALDQDVTLDASDVGAVPETRKICGHALSDDLTLTAQDVGAATGDYLFEVSVATSGWTYTANVGYSKTLTVTGLRVTDVATLALLTDDPDTLAAKRTAFSLLFRAVTGADALTLYASAAPATAYTLGVKVVR